jgi:hypothetical protein
MAWGWGSERGRLNICGDASWPARPSGTEAAFIAFQPSPALHTGNVLAPYPNVDPRLWNFGTIPVGSPTLGAPILIDLPCTPIMRAGHSDYVRC